MTVSYRNSATDTYHCLSCFLTRTGSGWLCLASGILIPVINRASRLYQTVPGSRMRQTLMHSFLLDISASYLAYIVVILLWVFVPPYARPVVTITIDSKFFWRRHLLNSRISWRHFQTLTKEAEYLHFFGRGSVFVISKQAFSSDAEADAFFETALGYWREAKVIAPPLPPDVSGVWPPAPRWGFSGTRWNPVRLAGILEATNKPRGLFTYYDTTRSAS